MKSININREVIANNAYGVHTSKLAKPVICIDTGELFTSAMDAAEKVKVSHSAMTACCSGRIRTCKGKHYSYVSKTSENIDILASHIRNMNAEYEEFKRKAALYDEIHAKEEAEIKAKEEYEKAYAKVLAKVERRQRIYENATEKWKLACARLEEAKKELEDFERN